MLKIILSVTVVTGAAVAGAAISKLSAADEIRCRVNVEALLHDLRAATGRAADPSAPGYQDRKALEDILKR